MTEEAYSLSILCANTYKPPKYTHMYKGVTFGQNIGLVLNTQRLEPGLVLPILTFTGPTSGAVVESRILFA